MRITQYLTIIICFFLTLQPVKAEVVEPIKIGVSTALTGDAATYGNDIKSTLLFVNELLGEGKYHLLFEDDQCSGREAVSIARKFIDIENVKYVIGFACSGALLSAAPVYERSRVIAMGVTTSSPRISEAGDFIFRVAPNDATAARVLAKHISKKYSDIAVLTEETDYCRDLTNVFKKEAERSGIALSEESFISGSTEGLPSLLQRIRQRQPKAIFLNVQAERPLADLVRRIRDMQWDIQIYAIYYPSSKSFLDAVGEDALGIRFVDLPPMIEYLDDTGKKMYQRFLEERNEVLNLEFVFVLAYKTLLALHQAIQSGEPVKEYLLHASFMGPTGEFSFDQNGDVQGVGLVQVMKEIEEDHSIVVID